MMLLKAGCVALLIALLVSGVSGRQDAKSSVAGRIKGKVRVEGKATAGDVAVTARQGEREAGRAVTNNKGEFVIDGLAPGLYSLTFRKPGLSVGAIDKVEVQAGKARTLSDRLIMKVDDGSLALVRGSVFTSEGRSVSRAQVEIARLDADGKPKKIDGRLTDEAGRFVFRLAPDTRKYRITVKADGAQVITHEVAVDGAAVYSVALSLPTTTGASP